MPVKLFEFSSLRIVHLLHRVLEGVMPMWSWGRLTLIWASGLENSLMMRYVD